MTYIVSGGVSNSTHSLTESLIFSFSVCVFTSCLHVVRRVCRRHYVLGVSALLCFNYFSCHVQLFTLSIVFLLKASMRCLGELLFILLLLNYWRLRGNNIWTVLYWQRATSSMGTVNRNSSHSPVWPWVGLCVFWVAWIIFMFMYVLFYLGQLSHFLSCFGACVTNLNEPPSSLLLPPRYCRLGAGSIP